MKVERARQQINLLIFDFIIESLKIVAFIEFYFITVRKQHKNNDSPKWNIMVNEVYSEGARSEFVK
jgi:hypothetical protein